MRRQQSMGDLLHNRLVATGTNIPKRKDIDAAVLYRRNNHAPFGSRCLLASRSVGWLPQRVPFPHIGG